MSHIATLYENSEFKKNLEKGLLCIDASSFSKIDCPRNFFYSYILKQVPDKGRSPLVFGGMVHEVLEAYYKNPDLDHVHIDSLIRRTLESKEHELAACADEKRNADTFVLMLQAYFNHTRAFGEYLKPIDIGGQLAVEQSFSLPLGTVKNGSITVMWEGKIDLICHDSRTNKIGIWDHKTTSRLGDTFINDKMRGNQFHGYLWAANRLTEATQKEPILDVGINALCHKSKGFEFQHYSFTRPDWAIEEWRKSVLSQLEMVIDNIFASAEPISAQSVCCGKYGNCHFYDVCEVRPSQREAMLSGLFKTSTWSPLGDIE